MLRGLHRHHTHLDMAQDLLMNRQTKHRRDVPVQLTHASWISGNGRVLDPLEVLMTEVIAAKIRGGLMFRTDPVDGQLALMMVWISVNDGENESVSVIEIVIR